MSISKSRSDAARRNGAQSRGPVSEEGRRRSSLNARKHSFFASVELLPYEDAAQFQALLDAYREEHSPASLTEEHYVRELADAEWRLQRVRSHATQIQIRFMPDDRASRNSGSAADAFHALAVHSPTLTLLLRYETKFQRQYDKALRELQHLADRRARAQALAAKEADAEARHAEAEEQAAIDEYVRDMIAHIESPTPALPAQPAVQNEPGNPPPDR